MLVLRKEGGNGADRRRAKALPPAHTRVSVRERYRWTSNHWTWSPTSSRWSSRPSSCSSSCR